MGRSRNRAEAFKTVAIGAMVFKIKDVDAMGDKYKVGGGEGLPCLPE